MNNIDLEVLSRAEVIVHNIKKAPAMAPLWGREKQHLRRGWKKSQPRQGRVNRVGKGKPGKSKVISTG